MNARMRMTVVGPDEIAPRCMDCGHPDCKREGPHAVECFECPSLCGRWRADVGHYLCAQCYADWPVKLVPA